MYHLKISQSAVNQITYLERRPGYASISTVPNLSNTYNISKKDRTTQMGGNDLIAVRKGIACSGMGNFSPLEMLWVRLELDFRILLAVCYRPPNSQTDEFNEEVCNFVGTITKKKKILINQFSFRSFFNFPGIDWSSLQLHDYYLNPVKPMPSFKLYISTIFTRWFLNPREMMLP